MSAYLVFPVAEPLGTFDELPFIEDIDMVPWSVGVEATFIDNHLINFRSIASDDSSPKSAVRRYCPESSVITAERMSAYVRKL